MIFWIIIVLFAIGWILTSSTTFLRNREFNEIDKFIYTLLYRGYAEESLANNACLIIRINYIDPYLAVYKYKEKGKIGLYFTVEKDKDLIGKHEEFLAEVKKKGLDYYVREIKEQALYVVDMGSDIEVVKGMIKFVYEKIFEEKSIFGASFRDICLNPNKIIDFEHAKELEEKGIDIKIPIVKWQWLIWKIKHPRKRV